MNSNIGVALRNKSRLARNLEERISKRLFTKKKSEGDHSEIEDYLDAYIGSKEQVKKQDKANTPSVATPNDKSSWGSVLVIGVLVVLAINFFSSDRGSSVLNSILNLKDSEKLNDLIVNGPSALNQDLNEDNKDNNSTLNEDTDSADQITIETQKNSLHNTNKKNRKKLGRMPAQNKKLLGAKPKKQLKKTRSKRSQIRN